MNFFTPAALPTGKCKNINCPEIDLNINMKATRQGSFIAVLGIASTVIPILQATSNGDILALAKGVIDALRILTTRFEQTGTTAPLDSEKTEQTSTHVNLTIGNANLTVDREAYRASRSSEFIKNSGKAACPQTQNSYDHVDISIPDTNNTVTITNDAAQSMTNVSTADQVLEPDIETKTLQIEVIQVNSHKWKFRDGGEKYYAEIQDKQFLKEWNNRNIVPSGRHAQSSTTHRTLRPQPNPHQRQTHHTQSRTPHSPRAPAHLRQPLLAPPRTMLTHSKLHR